jgi:hypothetical protein
LADLFALLQFVEPLLDAFVLLLDFAEPVADGGQRRVLEVLAVGLLGLLVFGQWLFGRWLGQVADAFVSQRLFQGGWLGLELRPGLALGRLGRRVFFDAGE